MDADDLWNALVDIFGEIGVWLVPLWAFLLAIVAELCFYGVSGHWWAP